jgi:single-stranded DNA-binding protein
MNLNGLQCVGRGNLVSKPESRIIGTSGRVVTNARIAFNRYYKQGEDRKKETVFLDVCAFNSLAKRLSTFDKGDYLMITGTITDDSYQSKEHGMIVKMKVMLDSVDKLYTVDTSNKDSKSSESTPSTPEPPTTPENVDSVEYTDEIPF